MKKNFILVLAMLVIPTIIFSQIMYNVSKPFSYEKSGLKNISELPLIHFPVNNDGNLIEQNLKLNIKEKAVNEIIDNKFVTRMKVKVFAEKLGMMTLILDNVRLNNNSYCYVYTPDYKIVAGPIYQGSIDKYLIIKEIPTDELIIEVISNFASDFDLFIDEVDFHSKFNKINKSKISEVFFKSYDKLHQCNYGEITFYDSTQLIREYRCNELGDDGLHKLFKRTDNFKCINDYNLSASRASATIYYPIFTNDTLYRRYEGKNVTLINFPDFNCNQSNDCGYGFLITVTHNGDAGLIINAEKNKDTNFLNSVLIRFNLHHKYGTPWHLKDIDCIASEENYIKWRETIDFSEVIDYCGVNVFAYELDYGYERGQDFMIYRMKQKPFFKELHLGWSLQKEFDDINSTSKLSNFMGIGKGGLNPTQAIIGSNISFSPDFTINMNITKKSELGSLTGYSGSILTNTDYNNTKEVLAYGIFKQAGDDFINSRLIHRLFNLTDSLRFQDSCLSYFHFTSIMNYINVIAPTDLLNRNFSYVSTNGQIINSTHKWMPSKDNKQKCPSTQGIISENNYQPCNFDIANYISWNDSTKCFTIDSIPANLFPGGILPKGYRIYHNFGDQKTIKFEPFVDQTNIEFPINACIDNCDLIYLLTLGKTNINIAIDFYDADGRVLNNPGCDSLKYSIPFNLNLCDLFDVTITKVDSSQSWQGRCTYRFEISFDGCSKDNPMFYNIVKSLKYQYANYPIFRLDEIPSININYNDQTLVFNYSISDPRFSIMLDGNIKCDLDSINFQLCNCDCNSNQLMSNWIDINMEYGGEGNNCPEYMCKVNAKFNIPSFYNCFSHYAVEDSSMKLPLVIEGNINYDFPCIYKGVSQKFKFYLFRRPGDTPACVIEKEVYCPLQEYPVSPCVPDCEDIPFEPSLFKEVNLDGCPGCKAIVEYTYRRSTCFEQTRQDLQVLSFKLQSDDPSLCSNCSLSPSDIYKQAIHKIIYDNDMGFNPKFPNGDCDTTWRIIQSTCWSEGLWYPPIEMPVSLPRWAACEGAGCCIKNLIVCRYSTGLQIYLNGGSIETDTCGNYYRAYENIIIGPSGIPEYGIDSVACEEKCDWLNGLEVFDYTGKESMMDEDNNINLFTDEDLIINTQQFSEFLKVQIQSKIEDLSIRISIYDLLGSEQLSISRNLQKGKNEFNLNTQHLKTGVYLLSLTSDTTLNTSKKFFIIK